KTRRSGGLQLLGDCGFRGLEIFSFVCAAGQGEGQHEEGEHQDWTHRLDFHRFCISTATIRLASTSKQTVASCRGSDHPEARPIACATSDATGFSGLLAAALAALALPWRQRPTPRHV